jgi:uncharacterized protein
MVVQDVIFLSNNVKISGIFCYPPGRLPQFGVLILHGAGESNKERFRDWQEAIASIGGCTLAIDFAGWGTSGGPKEEQTLNTRLQNAQDALSTLENKLGFNDSQVFVLGSSMSGHVACRLVEIHPKLKSVILTAAAAYGTEAEDKHFNEEFSLEIRREASWINSPCFDIIRKYSGRVFVAYGENDQVIPEGIKLRYRDAIKNKGDFKIIKDRAHKLIDPQNEREIAAARLLESDVLNFIREVNNDRKNA